MEDDFEIEVTDLRTGRRVEQPSSFPPALPSPATEPTEVLDDEEAPWAAQPARGWGQWENRRARNTAATLAAVALVGVVLLASVPNSRATLGALLNIATPTPTVRLAPGGDTFYATHTVPWGRLLVDGQPIAPIQDPNGIRLLYFKLPRGTHTLEYDAAPFPTVTCQVSVPGNGHDTCPLDTSGVPVSALPMVAERRLDMHATLDRLPPDAQLMLIKQAGGAIYSLDAQSDGKPGDHFAAPDGSAQVASESFQATMTYTLNVNPDRSSQYLPPNCATLCDIGGDGPDLGTWQIAAHVVPMWQYTFADGQSMAGPALRSVPNDMVIPLEVTWTGTWQVAVVNRGYNALCSVAISALTAGGGSTAGTTTTSIRTNGAPDSADGCFIGVSVVDANGTPQGTEAQVLYRFGLLLAANGPARQMFPDLPIANGHEQALAQQMAQQSGP